MFSNEAMNAQTGQFATYLIAFCLFWFCLGDWLAMAPTITLRFFKPNQYAQNYGLVFTAYGVGASASQFCSKQEYSDGNHYIASNF